MGPFVRGPGPSWGLCCRAWAVLGPLFGAMLAVLGRSWGLCWRSWLLLGPLLAVLSRLGPKNVEEHDYPKKRAYFSSGSAICGLGVRSWAALGPSVGGLGPLLGPMLPVLGRCSRSWAALGAFVGGPGPSWAEKWPWPEREGDLASGQGRKVALARGRRRSGTPPEAA